MALVLSIKQGHDFYIGDIRYSIEAVQPDGCTLHQHGEMQDKFFDVTCDKVTEVAPQIFIRAGLASRKGEVSLDIKAPKNILILRGGIMNAHPNQQV